MFGELPPSVSGVIHCLDCLLAEHPTFSAKTIEELLHRWVRQVQVVDTDAITDVKLKTAVKKWVRPGTDFCVIHEMRRILQLVVAPLADARRRRDGAIGRVLAQLLESSVPESADYGATSIQVPFHPGLYVAVLAVEAAHRKERLPRLRDIAKALKESGIQGGESSAKRYAARLRAAGVQFDRGAGRPRSKSKQVAE